MKTRKHIPQELEKLRTRFEQWRSEHPKGSRIPQSLWQEAVRMARRYGVSRVSNFLKLSYACLQRKVEPQDSLSALNPPAKTPGFVELGFQSLTHVACSLRVERGKGKSVTLTLSGLSPEDAIKAACGLWEARP